MFRRAVVSGRLDLATADYLDPAWYRRVRWTIQEMEREDTLRIEELRHHARCAGISSPLYEYANEQVKAANEILDKIQALLRPWEKVKTLADHAREMTEAWERLHGGKVGSREMDERIASTVAAMQRRADEGRKQREYKLEPRRKAPPKPGRTRRF